MKITWLGHSCFVLESGGFRLLLDPYQNVPGLPDVTAEADAVYCSHGHFDHAYTAHVACSGRGAGPFAVREIPAFHDEVRGAKRGENMIRCFTAEGLTVVHLGDLGHPLDPQQLAAVSGCDALLLPIGGTYTLNAREAKAVADAAAPRVVVPMHYRCGSMGFDVLETLEDFLPLFPPELVRRCGGSTLDLTADTPRQVAVLQV